MKWVRPEADAGPAVPISSVRQKVTRRSTK
jgi:hypothetical protein